MSSLAPGPSTAPPYANSEQAGGQAGERAIQPVLRNPPQRIATVLAGDSTESSGELRNPPQQISEQAVPVQVTTSAPPERALDDLTQVVQPDRQRWHLPNSQIERAQRVADAPPGIGVGVEKIIRENKERRPKPDKPLPPIPVHVPLGTNGETSVSEQARLMRERASQMPRDIEAATRDKRGRLRYPNGMVVPRDKDPILLDRMLQVEELHLMGLSYRQIAAQLKLTSSVVVADMGATQKIWLDRVAGRVDELRSRSVAVLRQVQRQAWADHMQTPVGGAQRNAYLITVKQSEEAIANLLGLAKPAKIAFTDPEGEEQYTGLSDDALVKGITKLLDSARARRLAAPDSGSEVPLELTGSTEANPADNGLLRLGYQSWQGIREDQGGSGDGQDMGPD